MGQTSLFEEKTEHDNKEVLLEEWLHSLKHKNREKEPLSYDLV